MHLFPTLLSRLRRLEWTKGAPIVISAYLTYSQTVNKCLKLPFLARPDTEEAAASKKTPVALTEDVMSTKSNSLPSSG